jgi:hypothetical protein
MPLTTIPNPFAVIAGAVSWAILIAILSVCYGLSVGPAMMLGRGSPDL